MIFVLLLHHLPLIASMERCNTFKSCEECTNSFCIWCIGASVCVSSIYMCHPRNTVDHVTNCPRTFSSNSSGKLPFYNESFVKREVLYLIAASNSINNSITGNENAASECVSKLSPDVELLSTLETNCYRDWDRCAALVALHRSLKFIVIGFRTSTRLPSSQFFNQFANYILGKMSPIGENEGRVVSYVYETFWDLWNGGLADMVKKLAAKHTKYNFLLVGTSLGGSQAHVAAFYLNKVFPNRKIHLYSFNSPRTGDAQFVSGLKLATSFRIVRSRDWIPDMPFRISDRLKTQHTLYEVMYSTTDPGDPYTICLQAEDNTCSRNTWFKNPYAHVRVFQNLHTWFEDGCAK